MAVVEGVDAMYLDNLDEFINDENKVVTYRWLSTTLQVHVNQGKQMLYDFVTKQRNSNKDDDLNVTYFVAGLQKNENNSTKVHRCEVVSEDRLEAVKSTLQKLYSCHIYSVQKSKLSKSDALYITDYNLMKENIFESCKHGSIHFDAVKRGVKPESVAQEVKKEVITPPAVSSSITNPVKSENRQKAGTAQKNNSSNGKMAGSIAGMFAKVQVKKESPKVNEQNQDSSKSETKQTAKKDSTASKKPTGVMSFFANSAVKTKPSEEKPPVVKKEPPVVKKEPPVVKKEPPVVSDKKKKRTGERKETASDSDEDFVHQKKKRRRIKDNLFDSSSSSNEEEMEAEEPLPSPAQSADSEGDKQDNADKEEGEKEDDKEEKEDDEDDESPIPDTPEQISKVQKTEPAHVVVTSDGRKRKRIKRKKKRHYTTKDGYMVTETVMESDSTDASDIEQPSNKDNDSSKPSIEIKKPVSSAAAAAKAIADKGKQKQSSLMSFFQKK